MVHKICIDEDGEFQSDSNWICKDCKLEQTPKPLLQVNLAECENTLRMDNRDLLLVLIQQQKGILNFLSFMSEKYEEWHKSMYEVNKVIKENEILKDRITIIENKLKIFQSDKEKLKTGITADKKGKTNVPVEVRIETISNIQEDLEKKTKENNIIAERGNEENIEEVNYAKATKTKNDVNKPSTSTSVEKEGVEEKKEENEGQWIQVENY
ncbi:hypothetical protein O3M35_009405 [Rhynocoris fuscipes]|uniref:Uncharacterized protein n=1 Tax=Rhynocoris fuscipes TaxID=488301 RepID=A0AAW1D3L8_9HEMI